MRHIITLSLICLLFAACGLGGAKRAAYPNKVTPETQAAFNSADAVYRDKRFAEADAAFGKFIAQYPYTELTDESRFRRGEIAFVKKNYEQALVFYRQAYSEIASPQVAPKAEFKASLSLYNLGRQKEALEEISKIDRKDASAVLRMRADSLGVRASKALGLSESDAIAWNLFLLDDYVDSHGIAPGGVPPKELVSEAEALASVRKWMTDPAISDDEIKKLPMRQMKGKRSGGFAAYKLALALQSNGETRAAIRQLKSYVSTYPTHENYAAARALLSDMGGAVGEGAGVAIGVLLPLSGRYSTYGETTLHGIECAVGVYDPCVGPGGMRLVVRDTESNGIKEAIDELAAEDVVAIIGPLLSAEAMDAANHAQELGIPLISLSQHTGIAEVGDYIFRNSISDNSEMNTLADFAIHKMNLKRFYVLYPGSKKSLEYRSLFTDAVKSLGGTVVASRSYSFTQPVEADELRGRGAQEFGPQIKGKGRSSESSEGEERFSIDLSAGTSYDAVFIPDSLSMAGFIVKSLGEDAGKSHLLGISRWDDEHLVEHAGSSVEGAVFVDSFYKNSPADYVVNFIFRYKQAYGAQPTLLEALGFDAARLVINAVQTRGATRRESVKNVLAKTSGFPGVSGKITFNSNRDAERELWVLKIHNGSIEPAK